jgi:opacity protein-like surface antigen
MRHTRTILLPVLTLNLIGSCAYAQRTPGNYSIGAFGGMAAIQRPEQMKDKVKSGYGFGGELKYNINTKMSVAGGYSMLVFGLKDQTIEGAKATLEGGGRKSNVIQANLHYYLMPPESTSELYLIGGGGYYTQKTEDPDKVMTKIEGGTIDITDRYLAQQDDDSKTESDFGLQFGAGMDLPFGPMKLFFEGKYHIVFSKDEDPGAENINMITVMAGVRFPM